MACGPNVDQWGTGLWPGSLWHMGSYKDQLIQEEEQGWSFTSQHVCSGCVNDYALQAAIGAAEEATATCDFCGSTPAAELDVLLEAFVKGIETEYEDAAEGVYYDGREGGYQWHRKWETWDLVEEFSDVLIGEGLLDAVREAMHDRVWVEVHFIEPRQDEALIASWERFCEAVQYETRYVFWLRGDEADEHHAEPARSRPAASSTNSAT
jgi:hypothetical protein